MIFVFNTHITSDYGYNIHWSWTCHWRRTTNVPFLRTATQHVHRYLDDVKHKARASTDICLCQRPGFLHTWLAKAETLPSSWPRYATSNAASESDCTEYLIINSFILLLVPASLQATYHTKWFCSIFSTHTSTTHQRAFSATLYQLNLAVVP